MRSKPLHRMLLSAFLLLLPLTALGQLPRPPGEERHPSEQEEKALHEQAKKMNRERQEALVRDSDKLLKLANELKAYVDKSNENILSIEVVLKADEIEKLAHSVKTKMKGN